ncbi:unnamed protein product, partial [Scytosiphon promiscuus]
ARLTTRGSTSRPGGEGSQTSSSSSRGRGGKRANRQHSPGRASPDRRPLLHHERAARSASGESMGCAYSTPRGVALSGSFRQQNQIMSPELREDIHEDLGIALVACSLKGWRKTQEDTSSIVLNLGGRKDMVGVGVFDGHSGQEASKYVAENLWNEVTATAQWARGDVDGALRAAFLAVDACMHKEQVCHGTTAVVAVVTPSLLYIANCGDSRAVLCKEGAATAVSTDHKPGVYTEKCRVIRCGGQVIPGEFGGVSRVTAPGCLVAMATSRSLGDFHFKRNYHSSQSEQVVSPEAEVVCVPRSSGDEFLILGTDGVWDVLSNQEVSDMMRVSERARRPSTMAIAPPPPILWENSSANTSASATAAAAAATAATVKGGGRPGGLGASDGGISRGLRPGAPHVARGSAEHTGPSSSSLSTNGFAAAAAAPPTPYHAPITPHHPKPPAPFGASVAAASAAAAAAVEEDADSYESSYCSSSDAEGEASAADASPSQVGMDIDGASGGDGADGRAGGGGAGGGAFTPWSSLREGGKSRRPAFIRLITPTLMRLVTPTPPNPANRGSRAGSADGEGVVGQGGGEGGVGGRRSPPGTLGGGNFRVIAEGVPAGEEASAPPVVDGDCGGVGTVTGDTPAVDAGGGAGSLDAGGKIGAGAGEGRAREVLEGEESESGRVSAVAVVDRDVTDAEENSPCAAAAAAVEAGASKVAVEPADVPGTAAAPEVVLEEEEEGERGLGCVSAVMEAPAEAAADGAGGKGDEASAATAASDGDGSTGATEASRTSGAAGAAAAVGLEAGGLDAGGVSPAVGIAAGSTVDGDSSSSSDVAPHAVASAAAVEGDEIAGACPGGIPDAATAGDRTLQDGGVEAAGVDATTTAAAAPIAALAAAAPAAEPPALTPGEEAEPPAPLPAGEAEAPDQAGGSAGAVGTEGTVHRDTAET